LKIVAVKLPILHPTEHLEDIATLTGATVLSKETHSLHRVDPVYVMGKCDKVQISQTQTIVVNGHGNKDLIESRVSLLQS